MVIASYNNTAFCLDDAPMLLSEVTATIDVRCTVTLQDGSTESFTEVYSPDAAGQVIIRDLGRMAMTYFRPMDFTLNGTVRAGGCVKLEAKVFTASTDNQLGSFAKTYLFSNCRTTIGSPYKYRGFLSRYHRRNVRADQQMTLSWIDNGQTLGIGVYHDGEYLQADAQASSTLNQLVISCWSLERVCQLIKKKKSKTLDPGKVKYLIFYLYADGANLDAIQFSIDRSYKPALTHFVFYNAFGLPETLCFTGRDTRTAEMEAEFATAGHEYRKLSSELDIKHRINSGYIDGVTRETAEDLATSSQAWLYSGNTLGEKITLTEVSFEESLPRTEPVNVAITYRLANEVQRTIDRDMTLDYRIFDHTFGVEFE